MIPVPVHTENSEMPAYARPGDAGADLCAAQDVELGPFERALIPTGVYAAIPQGYAGFVLPRSGLALHQGLALVNSPGLIDSNYRGEIQLVAINLDRQESIVLQKGERVAQLVILRVEQADFLRSARLSDTARGAHGFGSSGR